MRNRNVVILVTCGALSALLLVLSSPSAAQAPPASASTPLPVVQ